ncbi:hypothetical protein SNE40_017605 [Patella caerulea]|uniref:Uncharacterized protein n=1 Tax=Patella caerulea TaxID=87958 RepID=A0AAN8PM74_PATCE
MNTCQSLGSNRGAVEQPLTQAKENYNKLCGSDGGKSAQENCDVAGCMGQMANVNPEDTEQSCPAMSKAIGCLEKAVNNCQVLGDQKAAIEEPLKEAKKTYKSYCSASGVIQPQYLLIFITVAILSAFYTRL